MRKCLWNVTRIVAATPGCENQKILGKIGTARNFHLNGAPVTVVGATPKTSASLGESTKDYERAVVVEAEVKKEQGRPLVGVSGVVRSKRI